MIFFSSKLAKVSREKRQRARIQTYSRCLPSNINITAVILLCLPMCVFLYIASLLALHFSLAYFFSFIVLLMLLIKLNFSNFRRPNRRFHTLKSEKCGNIKLTRLWDVCCNISASISRETLFHIFFLFLASFRYDKCNRTFFVTLKRDFTITCG